MTKEERNALRRQIREGEVRSNAQKDQLFAIISSNPALYDEMVKQLGTIIDRNKDAPPNTVDFLEGFCASSFRVELTKAFYTRILDLEDEKDGII